MKTLYTDASFDWNHTDETTENVVRGKIAVTNRRDLKQIEKIAIGKIGGLKQYINVFELIAIARAVELASLENPKADSLVILTDSNVAMFWARNGIKKKELITEAHASALEYLRKARIQFGGIVTFNYIPRHKNPAGHLLKAELDAGKKPHEV